MPCLSWAEARTLTRALSWEASAQRPVAWQRNDSLRPTSVCLLVSVSLAAQGKGYIELKVFLVRGMEWGGIGFYESEF